MFHIQNLTIVAINVNYCIYISKIFFMKNENFETMILER